MVDVSVSTSTTDREGARLDRRVLGGARPVRLKRRVRLDRRVRLERRLIVLAALTAVVAASMSVDPGALCLLPALLLTIPLLLRRYPGERALAVLRGSAVRRSKAPSVLEPSARRSTTLVARGGLLLACSLAVRPPPPLAHRTN